MQYLLLYVYVNKYTYLSILLYLGKDKTLEIKVSIRKLRLFCKITITSEHISPAGPTQSSL